MNQEQTKKWNEAEGYIVIKQHSEKAVTLIIHSDWL